MNEQRTKITGITVSNYKSIGREQHIPLGPLTVLVGPNGSGKSNVVDVLTFVRDAMDIGLSQALRIRGGFDAIRHRGSSDPHKIYIKLDVKLESCPGSYAFEIASDQEQAFGVKLEEARLSKDRDEVSFTLDHHDGIGNTWRGPPGLEPQINPISLALPMVAGDKRFTSLFDLLSRLVIYSIYPNQMLLIQNHVFSEQMYRHGDNWVSVLERQESSMKSDLVAGLNRLTGDISDVRVTGDPSNRVAQFRHGSKKEDKWFNMYQESDGTLRVAGILTALLQEPPLPIIGIEEPELTVHPGALPLLMDYLRQASKQSQVIITTHSPELLDLVKPHEVQVVERTNGATSIHPMAQYQRKAVSDRLLRLGELMTMEGLQQEEQETAK